MLKVKNLTEIDNSISYKYIFVHTPFCGTCQLARRMLNTIEHIWETDLFYEMNASLFPEFMMKKEIKSVPCLIIIRNGVIQESIYAFESVTNIYNRIKTYSDQK
ncbi:thioredoxin [Aquibacillus halophilus]|uniref:Thioredoxin n=1 Tax=Aquibacillus halophilus TaxID=930132 RepID=A0A6A8DHJ4_9BACI|nr:thioredoxin family protein [Aquibacillus halophilus]MRH44700.1 thioredoxin [Aquibacillus halophilus]